MLDNIIPVWYTHGMRGNAIYRILATHPEAYWYNYVHAGSNSQHPLHIPSNATYIEGLEDGNNIAVKIGMWKMGYATYHTCSLFTQTCFNQVMYKWARNNDKLLFCLVNPILKIKNKHTNFDKLTGKQLGLFWRPEEIATYPTHKELGISTKQYKLVDPDNPHIWVYGTRDRLGMTKQYFEPSIKSTAYNLNIDALFSTDYVTFETEYYSLIAHFNLTSCLNDVRAFILLVLEREQHISKFY